MRLALVLLFAVSITATAQKAPAIDYGNNTSVGKYFTHGGVKVYYETYGAGKPLVLIHGNGGSIKGRGSFIEEFSKKYRVIMMDNRCHGKTDCPLGPLTYEQMAEDLFLLLNHLKTDSTLIWGHSDGGIVGLLLAIKYPAKVRKLLASGANLRPDTTAVDPGLFPLLAKMKELAMNDSTRLKQYKLMAEQPNIPVNDLHKIKCDVLVMAGDRDAIRNEHTLEIFNNIPGALLCILPGTTHFVYDDRRNWFTEILYDFFEHPPARTTTVDVIKRNFGN